jgi:hypothetical protein
VRNRPRPTTTASPGFGRGLAEYSGVLEVLPGVAEKGLAALGVASKENNTISLLS